MARESVAVDYMGVGAAGSPDPSSDDRVRLVRPIPSVPESRGGHSRRSPAPEGGRDNSFPFASQGLHGLRQQPWNRPPVAARFQADEDHSTKAIVSPKRERESTDGPLIAHHQPLSQWENSAPGSPSGHHPTGPSSRYDEYLRMQQARKAAAMYANHQQASRGLHNGGARTSSLRDESQRGAQPSSDRAGPEHLGTQPQPPASQGGFGSPAPFPSRAKQANGVENGAGGLAGNKRLPFQQQHPFHGGNLPSHALARPAGIGKQQPRTAQLTIFYAGMVNVYDDVPSDKAQAIMLLAGSGNTWSSNYMNPPGSGGAPGRPFSAPMAVPQSTPSTPGSPAPQMPTTSAAQPPRPVLPGVVFSNVRQPPINNVELPQARKASLARFLEKRKDRARKVPVKEEGDTSPSRDKSPGPSVGKPPTRSPSPAPAPAVHDHASSPPTGSRQPPGASTCSESSSPTRPPRTPPRQTVSEEKTAGAPKRRSFETDQNAKKRTRSGRSPCRLDGENTSDHAMEDDSSSLQ